MDYGYKRICMKPHFNILACTNGEPTKRIDTNGKRSHIIMIIIYKTGPHWHYLQHTQVVWLMAQSGDRTEFIMHTYTIYLNPYINYEACINKKRTALIYNSFY